VTLSLDVTQIEDGTPGTKAIQEPDVSGVTTDSQIKNFVVLQFGGTTSAAQLVGGQLYFDHWPLNSGENVALVASSSATTIVVLANTFGPIPISAATTLGEFLANDYTTIYGLSEVLTTSGGNDYLRLSGSQVLASVSLGANVGVSLKRNVAKIVINVTNATHDKTGDNKVTFSNVQLRGINSKYYYLTNVAAALAPLKFDDSYSGADPRRFDNAMEVFPADKNPAGEHKGTAEQYVYYVPANLRGTTNSTAQSTKPIGAPEGSTYFCVFGTYGDSNTPVAYTYYLGGNLTNDFNLEPNHKYTYNISIKSKGDEDLDSRVEDLKEIYFTTDANCYMVHPPKMEGRTRVYSFPVRRAAVFWNTEAQGGLYGANTMTGYGGLLLDGSYKWDPVIIWSDFDMSAYMSGDAKFLAVDTGSGYDPDNIDLVHGIHTQPYIKVRISHGMSGNVVVGMKSKNGEILWSWHIWITDYDPDVPMTPVAGKYIYGVYDGDIHRHNNTIWTTTATESVIGYANGFAMDRNLGARNTRYGTNNGSGLYYQFGRKDPFTNKSTFYWQGLPPATSVLAGRLIRNDAVEGTGGKNVRYSVLHPEVFICGTDSDSKWTLLTDDLSDGGIWNNYWHDKKYFTDEAKCHELKKSIYDPCPPGWKLPINGMWDGFNTTSTRFGSNGRYYYPEGYENRNATGRLFFPLTGYRDYSSGAITAMTTTGYYWLSQSAIVFNFTSSSVITTLTRARSYAFPVRCVRE